MGSCCPRLGTLLGGGVPPENLNPTDIPFIEEAQDSEDDTFIPLAEVTEVVWKLLSGKGPRVDVICPKHLSFLNVVGLSYSSHMSTSSYGSWGQYAGLGVPPFKKGGQRVFQISGSTLLTSLGKFMFSSICSTVAGGVAFFGLLGESIQGLKGFRFGNDWILLLFARTLVVKELE